MHSDADLAPEAAGALAVLHARYSDDIHKHVRRLVSDEKEADDVTRAVFARAREELANGGRAPSSLRSWVLAIAQQEAVNRARAQPEAPPTDVARDGSSWAWRGRQRAARPAPAPQPERPARPPAPGPAPNTAAGCPSLRYADDPTNRYSRPTQLHRCYAAGYPAPVSLQEQRNLCLTAGFAMCPRLGGGAQSDEDAEDEPTEAGAPASATESAEVVWTAPYASAAPAGAAEPAPRVVPPPPPTNGHTEAAPSVPRRPDVRARQPASADSRTSDEGPREAGATEPARPPSAPPVETNGHGPSEGVWADLVEDLGRPDTASSEPITELDEAAPLAATAPPTFDVRNEIEPDIAESRVDVGADYGSGFAAAPAEPWLAGDSSQGGAAPDGFVAWAEPPTSITPAPDAAPHVAVASEPDASPDVEITSASYELPYYDESPPFRASRSRQTPAAQASVSRAMVRTGGALRHVSSVVMSRVLLVALAPWALARLAGRTVAELWLWARPRLRAGAALLRRLLGRFVGLCASAVRATAALLVAALIQGARLAKAGALLLLAAVIRALQLAKVAAVFVTRALVRRVWLVAVGAQRLAQRSSGYEGPQRAASAATAVVPAQDAFVPAAHAEVPKRDATEAKPVRLPEAAIELPPAPAPVVITPPGAWPDFDPEAMPARKDLGIDEQLLPAILALGQRGVAVTAVVRDQRGVRVKGTVDGRPISSWYSLDECSQLRVRSAWAEAATAEIEEKPDIAPVERRRSRWPLLALLGLVVVAVLSFTAVSWPAERVELTVMQPTSAYADDGTVLWTASPGERYRVLQEDGERLLALSEAGESPRVARLAWFLRGSSVSVASNRPEFLRLASSWAGGLPGLMDDLLR